MVDGPKDHESARGLEAQRVFAKVARSMLGMPVAPPTIGRFQVRERMGSGGMGEIYGAYDPEQQRQVAIKVLRADRNADPAAIRRMKREAKALIRLDHPNVVKIYEVGTLDDQVFFAMELLQGQTLSHRLDREPRLSPAETFELLADVCAALECAHTCGVIHRDLKPANIFLADGPAGGPTGHQVKVLDFGLAKLVSAGTLDVSTASGTIMGTLHYMSPEQARDSTKIDPRCDLWAVAIIAYECLVGHRPFRADTMSELAVQLLTGDPPVPSEHADVPAGFDAWFARAAHRDIERRYPTARALEDGLAQALGQPPRPKAPSSRAPDRRWRLLLLVVGVAALGWGVARAYATRQAPASSPEPADDESTQEIVPALRPVEPPAQSDGTGVIPPAETIEPRAEPDLGIDTSPPEATRPRPPTTPHDSATPPKTNVNDLEF